MKVTVLLADAGQTDSSGKAHVLGLGWTVTDAPTTQPMAVLVLLSFDGSQDAAGRHEIVLRLVGADEVPVEIPGTGDPVILKAEVDVQPRGDGGMDAPATAPFIVNAGPGLPLKPGERYRWEAVVDGQAEHRADVSFVTRDVVASSA